MLWVIGLTVLATSLMLVLLQNLKTPEKVVEQKVEHRHAISDPQFRREMSVLLGPAIVRGNQVIVLQNGNEIFPAMLLAIRSAQISITFETLIYWSGEIGEEFSQALSDRARAGVPVNVIIDWVGSNKGDPSNLHRFKAGTHRRGTVDTARGKRSNRHRWRNHRHQPKVEHEHVRCEGLNSCPHLRPSSI